MMSLLFGNLTKEFVDFTTTSMLAKAGDPDAIANLPAQADKFRRVAALDASYLTYIGMAFYSGKFSPNQPST